MKRNILCEIIVTSLHKGMFSFNGDFGKNASGVLCCILLIAQCIIMALFDDIGDVRYFSEGMSSTEPTYKITDKHKTVRYI